ncbi:hypothetical protein [Bradyrhizobium sp. CCBAU 11357]|nr:hypothetical protein [Bradyrhizobium sp. CCBAU 11357]
MRSLIFGTAFLTLATIGCSTFISAVPRGMQRPQHSQNGSRQQ